MNRRELLALGGTSLIAGLVLKPPRTACGQSTVDYTPMTNWAKYMNSQNAFGPATTWATAFCKQWAPLARKVVHDGYVPVASDVTGFASLTAEYGQGGLSDFMTYWPNSPTSFCVMGSPYVGMNNPAGYPQAGWGIQGTIISNKVSATLPAPGYDETPIITSALSTFGITAPSPLNSPTYEIDASGAPAIGWILMFFGTLGFPISDYVISADDGSGETLPTPTYIDSDYEADASTTVIYDWVEGMSAMSSFASGAWPSGSCASIGKLWAALDAGAAAVITFLKYIGSFSTTAEAAAALGLS
jgi:hypothetical protein